MIIVFLKKFDTRIKANEYFKSKSIGKTTQLHGWQTSKCKKCENFDGHKMNSVLRYKHIVSLRMNS
jgi:hypothetical protein